MVRIATSLNNGTATLRVEGQLTGNSVAELTTAADRLLACADSLKLDLSAVSFADQKGVGALRALIIGGAQMESCSGFVEQLLSIEAQASPTPAHPSEEEFIARLRSGDEAAFEEMVRRFGGRMLSVARRFLSSEDDARDAVQEAFLSAFESIDRFSGSARLSTWLHRIVVNAALMQLRRRRRKPEHSIDELMPRFDTNGGWAEDSTTAGLTPEALCEERDTCKMVWRCIAKLPEVYRAVLLLRDIEDLDTIETARRFGISPNSVKVRLHRAHQALRTLVEREAGAVRSSSRAENVSAKAA